ncbi:hypothetical protein [Catellatospora chokoriensis]|nr:hypothetical protein [Catellatospora chokoriensis]
MPLVRCGLCRQRVREVHLEGGRRAHDCGNGCRRQPIDGQWLDDQIHRALAGKIALHRAAEAVEAISVGAVDPISLRVLWRQVFPAGPQPTATARPATVFLPTSRRLS